MNRSSVQEKSAVFNDQKVRKTMAELAKKILLTGLGAVFMTEEGIRKNLGELKVPKEAAHYLLESFRRQKDELLKIIAVELSSFFSKIRVHEEVQKALSGLQIHLDATLTFDRHEAHRRVTPKITVKRK